MDRLNNLINFLRLTTRQAFSKQGLDRRPENQQMLKQLDTKQYCSANKKSPLVLIDLLSVDLMKRIIKSEKITHHL